MIGALWIGVGLQFLVSSSQAGAQLDLAKADVQSLTEINALGGAAMDHETNNLFTKIFGGIDGAHIKKYFDERIKYLAEPDTFQYFFDQPVKMQDAKMSEADKATMEKQQKMTGAASIAGPLWLESLVRKVNVGVRFSDGEDFWIQSSRPGIMTLGPMYTDIVKDEQGHVLGRLSLTQRQSILLHEARHADCTGGVTQKQIRKLSKVKNLDARAEVFSGTQCLHTHNKCTTGNYKGIFACDHEPYGAYGVQYYFLLSRLLSAALENDRIAFEELKAVIVDSMSRLEYLSQEELEAFAAGALKVDPDMSSQGVVE